MFFLYLAIVQFFVRLLFPTCTHGQFVVPWWSRRIQHEYSTWLRIRWCRIHFLRWIFFSPMSSSIDSLSQEREWYQTRLSLICNESIEWRGRWRMLRTREGRHSLVDLLIPSTEKRPLTWRNVYSVRIKDVLKHVLKQMWRFTLDNSENERDEIQAKKRNKGT